MEENILIPTLIIIISFIGLFFVFKNVIKGVKGE